MRPPALVASGASGGLAGLALTLARDFLLSSSGTSGSVLVPPEPELVPLPGLDFLPSPAEGAQLHLTSFLLGLASGFFLWPILDLALLLRLLFSRSVRRAVRVQPAELDRVLE